MKRKQALRQISFWIAILMLALQIPFAAIADDVADAVGALTGGTADAGAESTAIVETAAPDAGLTLGPDELPWETLQDLRPEDVARPAAISLETALEKQHVNRLYAQETNLRTVIYQNKDGGKTTYIFNHPVKYVDSTGAIRDKSAALTVQNDGAYAMEDNSTQAYFPKNLKNGGVTVTYGAYSIAMVPNTLAIAAAAALQGGKVLYGSAFGPGTALQYETTLYGVKEDIVLARAPSTNRFSFSMRLVGLTPARIGEEWVLQNAEGVTVAALGEVLVKDSAGRRILGEMTITATASAGVYTLTLTVPQEFLADSETTYPVYVDPTITIEETMIDEYDSYNAIIDTGLYTGSYNFDYAESDSDNHYFGVEPGDGYGGILYRFPDFYQTNGLLAGMDASDIGTATMYVYLDSGETEGMNFNLHRLDTTYTGSDYAICDTDNLMDDHSYYLTTPSTTSITSGAGAVGINVTSMFKRWANYNSGVSTDAKDNPYNGMLVTTDLEQSYRLVRATEATDFNVYVVIDYTVIYTGNYYLNNGFTKKFLSRNASATTLGMGIYSTDTRYQFTLEYLADNDQYAIKVADGSGYYLHVSNGVLTLGIPYSGFTTDYRWIVSTAAGGGVTIKNASTSKMLADNGSGVTMMTEVASTAANYAQSVWRIIVPTDYVPIANFTMINTEASFECGTNQQISISVSPSNATWCDSMRDFSWNLSNTEFTINEDGYLTVPDSIGALTYLSVTHKPTGVTRLFEISAILPRGTYWIINKWSDSYMQPDDSGARFIEQQSSSGVCQQIWMIDYYGNGYYTIQNMGNRFYLTSPIPTIGVQIQELEWSINCLDRQLWKIIKTSSGSFKFQPKVTESMGMVMFGNYPNVSLDFDTNEPNNRYEWDIVPSNDQAIVIVPGIICSPLQNDEGTQLWFWINALWGIEFGQRVSQLACDENGNSINDILVYNPDNYGAGDFYKNIHNSLVEEYKNEYDVIFFAYDWRMSCANAAIELEHILSYYDNCVLVAHSMGGLVASSYLARSTNNRSKVAKLITLGTPYTGSPKALYVMETGKLIEVFDFITVNSGPILDIANNIPAIYELLPTARYFQTVANLVYAPNPISGYANTYNYLTTLDWAKKSDGNVKPMFAQATAFHNSLMLNGSHVVESSDVDVYKIYGIGEETVLNIIYDDSGNYDSFLYTTAGDGTVTVDSALNNQTSGNRTYSFNLSHTDLIKNQEVINLVKSIIDGGSSAAQTSARCVSEMSASSINQLPDTSNRDSNRITVVAKNIASLRIQNSEGAEIYAVGETLYYDDADGVAHKVGVVWSLGENACQYILYGGNYSITDIETVNSQASIQIDYNDYGLSNDAVRYEDFSDNDRINISLFQSRFYTQKEETSQ